jgi:hypothetical protein
MWDAGWAYQAGDFAQALELAERALALNKDGGRPDISAQLLPLMEACRAKLGGKRPPGEVPDACAFCAVPAHLPTVLKEPFIFICDTCLPVCEERTEALRLSGKLVESRFAPDRPVREMCSFCGIGARILLALAGGVRRPLCYECAEEFEETVEATAQRGSDQG